MRSAGCIINDLIDQDIDAKLKELPDRPIASKKISNFNALCFFNFTFSNWIIYFITI